MSCAEGIGSGQVLGDGAVRPAKQLLLQLKTPPAAAAAAQDGISSSGITLVAHVPGIDTLAADCGADSVVVGGASSSGGGSSRGRENGAVCPGVELAVVHTFPALLCAHQGDKKRPQWRLTKLQGHLKGLLGWRLFGLEAVRWKEEKDKGIWIHFVRSWCNSCCPLAGWRYQKFFEDGM